MRNIITLLLTSLFVLFGKIGFAQNQGIDVKTLWPKQINALLPLEWLDSTNQYALNGTLNDHKVSFLFDTASTSSDLILASLKKLGLEHQIIDDEIKGIDLRFGNVVVNQLGVSDLGDSYLDIGISGIICPQTFFERGTTIFDLASGHLSNLDVPIDEVLATLAKAFPQLPVNKGIITRDGPAAWSRIMPAKQISSQQSVSLPADDVVVILNASARRSSFRKKYFGDIPLHPETGLSYVAGADPNVPLVADEQSLSFAGKEGTLPQIRIDYNLANYPDKVGGVLGLDVLAAFALIFPEGGGNFYYIGPFE